MSDDVSALAPENPWHEPSGHAAGSEMGKFPRPQTGFICLPEVVVFSGANYGGHELRTNLNYRILAPRFNDDISSVIVVRGTWRFYRDAHYTGDYWDLSPGFYPNLYSPDHPGNAHDVISSFQCIDW
jgi:hypothetical protein